MEKTNKIFFIVAIVAVAIIALFFGASSFFTKEENLETRLADTELPNDVESLEQELDATAEFDIDFSELEASIEAQ